VNLPFSQRICDVNNVHNSAIRVDGTLLVSTSALSLHPGIKLRPRPHTTTFTLKNNVPVRTGVNGEVLKRWRGRYSMGPQQSRRGLGTENRCQYGSKFVIINIFKLARSSRYPTIAPGGVHMNSCRIQPANRKWPPSGLHDPTPHHHVSPLNDPYSFLLISLRWMITFLFFHQ